MELGTQHPVPNTREDKSYLQNRDGLAAHWRHSASLCGQPQACAGALPARENVFLVAQVLHASAITEMCGFG